MTIRYRVLKVDEVKPTIPKGTAVRFDLFEGKVLNELVLFAVPCGRAMLSGEGSKPFASDYASLVGAT
jgi:hypothetical protein